MKKKILALTLALSLLLASCGGEASASTTMYLRKTEGTVGVSDSEGKGVELQENLGLYSGYGVNTQAESYAWIDLDEVKLVKLDEDSEIVITKEDKELEVEVKSGSLFFNVTQPLADDESMNIRTSTMLVGIQDTCGWVVSHGNQGAQVFLLEGTVEAEDAGTGETVQVTAGNMAEVTVNGNGETEINVQPFVEEYIAPFVLTELEEDEDLAADILSASGLDALNPPDPAERLMADYQEIIANYPILDNGAAEGVSYTFNGSTFTADEGLADAVCVDLDGDGIEELLLVIREQGWWDYGWPISRLEIYGSEMGRAVLFDSTDFMDEDEYDHYDNRPNDFGIVVSGEKLYIHLARAYQAVESDYLFALENGALVLIESAMGGYVLSTQFTYVYPDDGVYTELELPTFPDDVQMKNALLPLVDTSERPYGSQYAKLVNTDLYRLYVWADYSYFEKISWNGAGIERTDLEDNIIYAALMDMDQDGSEELILILADHSSVAYSWKGTSCERTLLREEPVVEYLGLYRDTVTGNICLGSQTWRAIGLGERIAFDSLTDHDECTYDTEAILGYILHDASEYLTPAELEEANALLTQASAEFNRELERYDQIESINMFGDNSESFERLQYTVDEVRQQLMER